MPVPRYELVVLGRYPSLVAREDPQVAVEVRVSRDQRMANVGTLTMRESEWEPIRRALEERSCVDIDIAVETWPGRISLYSPA